MPDINHLRQLVAFADKGTLSGTARELHMSQPAVSRTMQRLETEFKVDLFDRSNNGIALNDNGHLAVTLARHVIEQYDSMLACANLMRVIDPLSSPHALRCLCSSYGG